MSFNDIVLSNYVLHDGNIDLYDSLEYIIIS